MSDLLAQLLILPVFWDITLILGLNSDIFFKKIQMNNSSMSFEKISVKWWETPVLILTASYWWVWANFIIMWYGVLILIASQSGHNCDKMASFLSRVNLWLKSSFIWITDWGTFECKELKVWEWAHLFPARKWKLFLSCCLLWGNTYSIKWKQTVLQSYTWRNCTHDPLINSTQWTVHRANSLMQSITF